MGKRSYFEWSVVQFSSWGLIQPLGLETPYLRRHSEHRECIELLWIFGWRGVKSLFYLICGKNLTPNGLSKDIPVLVMSAPCWTSVCLPFTPSLSSSTVGWGLLGNYCGFGTVVRWGGPSCFSLWRELHLHFWEMEIHISLGHPSTAPQTGAAGLHASICTQFTLLDLKYKGEVSGQEWNLSSWRM